MITITGADRFSKKVLSFYQDMQRSQESLLKQEARALCVALGAVTEPGGFEESKATAVRKTVAADIRRVFASKQNIHAVFAFTRRRSESLAHAFYRAAKAGDTRKAAQYLKEAGVGAEGLDKALHRSARTGKKGHVPKKTPYQAVVQGASLESYIRGKQETVGTAKAGWYAAALALGGRVRANLTDAVTGKRSTEEIFPAYIRKLARKFSGLGGAMVSPGRIEIWTNVRHARAALSPQMQAHAEDLARESFARALAKAMKFLREKHFSGSRAA